MPDGHPYYEGTKVVRLACLGKLARGLGQFDLVLAYQIGCSTGCLVVQIGTSDLSVEAAEVVQM